jgi:hypothetical protein
VNHHQQQQQQQEPNADKLNKKCDYNADNFILNLSIKSRSRLNSDCNETQVNDDDDDIANYNDADDIKLIDEDNFVYNVSNNRTQFNVTESAFNSLHFTLNASVFNWLNREQLLNLSATLHENVQFSSSYDLRQNKFLCANFSDKQSKVLFNMTRYTSLLLLRHL